MEEKKLDAQESIELISRMIQNTRNRLERNSGRPFLVWGYTTVVITLIIWGLVTYTQNRAWNWLWFALPVTAGIGMYLTRPRTQTGNVRTFIDHVLDKIWTVLGLTLFFSAVVSMTGLAQPPMLLLSVLLMAIGTTLTGLVIRFTPATIGGALSIILTPILIAPWGKWQVLVFILIFVAMMIIPGHILNYRSNHSNPKNECSKS